MPNYNIIGKSVPRLDGFAKVAGEAVFTADIDTRGAWVAGAVRADIAAGQIKGITKSPLFDWSKVVCITAADLPAVNYVAMIRPDYPILADQEISFATQGIAIIAAPDKETLAEAKRAIKVNTVATKPILSIENATKILDEYKIVCGDAAAGFKNSDVIVEGTYRTGYQEHAYLETHAFIATPTADGGVELYGSLQCPYYVHNAVVQALGLTGSPAKVVVRQAVTGGGFGGKEDYPSILGVWAALLARKANKKIKFFFDREEDLLCTTKRHPSKITHKTGVKKDGTIVAMEIDIVLDGGAFTTMSKVVLSRSILHATGCYRVPNAYIRARAVATNTPPNGAFRGFGVPQSNFALERHIDAIANTLKMSPLDVRLKNVMRNGDTFPYGQTMTSGVEAELVLKDVVKRSDYVRKHAEKRGIGLSLALHGGGFTGSGEDKMGTKVEVEVNDDVVTILASSTEMGQGAGTVLPMIAAETLGLPLSKVEYHQPDTSVVPNSGPTVASRTTMYVGGVVRDACLDLISKLKDFSKSEYRSEQIFETAEKYRAARGKLVGKAEYTPPPGYEWNDETYTGTAYKGYAWMAQTVEVEVDRDTYEIKPLKSTISVELGRAINPTLAVGQIEGGSSQAYGWGSIEETELTEHGKYASGHLSGYTIPTTLDTPRFDVALFETPCEFGAMGAKGIGELPMDGGAPALIAAVENATGVFAREIPLTGRHLFNLMEGGE